MPRVGDKVRVSYEGEVKTAGPSTFLLVDNTAHYYKPTNYKTTIEFLERAEVPWQDGDVAIHCDHFFVITRDNGDWFHADGSQVWRRETPETHTDKTYWTPLIRGGKRVVNK